jgi:hypothetical protein
MSTLLIRRLGVPALLLVLCFVAAPSAVARPRLQVPRVTEHAGRLQLDFRFSGGTVTASSVLANRFTHPRGDPTTLASASLLVKGVVVAHHAPLRTRDGTIIRATQAGPDARITIDPPDGRYKYLSYDVQTPKELGLALWRSGPPAAAGYVRRGFPPRLPRH